MGANQWARYGAGRIWNVARQLRAAWRRRQLLKAIAVETSGHLGLRNISVPLEIVEVDHITHRWDAIYRRRGDGYRLELPKAARMETAGKAGFLGPTYLYWLTQCSDAVKKIVVSVSDGEQPTMAQFSPSTNQPHVTPVPDPYFYLNDAFSSTRRFAEGHGVPWDVRSETLAWRGSGSGIGSFDPVLAAVCPHRVTQRILLCLAAKDIPGVDIGLSAYSRDEFAPEVLVRQGLIRAPLPEQSWIGRKFALDVDGQTNTWSNLIVRLHLGCCVLKVASRDGYRQWYYGRLRAWEHFIPVKADLSDLAEQIEWARTHDARAREIARNGQALARSLDFESVRREAVELIEAHWHEATYT